MYKGRLLLGILLDAAVAAFWLFPDVIFGGVWGASALPYPVIIAAASAPLIALSLVFFITAFHPRKAAKKEVSPWIVALLGAALFSSPFFGVGPTAHAYTLNIVLVVVGLSFIIWGGIGMLKDAPRVV